MGCLLAQPPCPSLGHMQNFTPPQAQLSPSFTPVSCQDARLYLPIFLVVAGISFGLVWQQDYYWLLQALYGLTVISWIPILVGATQLGFAHWTKPQEPPVLASTTGRLPRITILLPVYQEANMMAQLAEMLRALEYPAAKLQALLLIEADDRETAQAAIATAWPSFCQIMSVPTGGPKTKPRACNWALARATGDLLVVFDAEDKPHPQQLREAAARFKSGDEQLACVQAPLEIQAKPGRWMQAQFALEYAMLFRVLLPCLSRASRALPLGGTSNYFRTRVLRQLGGWDSYNLTEDADLGVKLARANFHTQTLSLPTLENAPDSLGVWYRQRTRWLSGHIQTLIVQSRPPMAAAIPLWRWLICMLVLSGRLISGPTHALALLWIGQNALHPSAHGPDFWSGLVPFLGYFFLWLVLICLVPSGGIANRIWLGLGHPIYWLMTVPAFLNAMKRMALGQLSWLKSAHQPYARQLPDKRARWPPIKKQTAK